jgi:DNA-binding transcriptional LysR family regulator
MTDVWRGLRDVTLRQLRTFRTVAARGSITAAARELHLSQPAVSMQLRELEESCGLALYERVGRGIQLTEAGRELAGAAAAVVETLRDSQERLDALRGLRTGLLRLAVVSTAKYFAPSILSAYGALHPGVSVQLTVGNREEVVARLADNACDLAIMGRPPGDLRTRGSAFAPHPLVIIAPRDHPRAGDSDIPLTELSADAFLVRERGSGTRAAMEELFSSRGIDYRTAMEVSSNETIKQAVIANMGISLLSAHTIALEVATARLAVLDVQGLPVMRQWHALYREGKRLSPAAETFLDYLQRHGAERIEAALAVA